jgi:hypothetical protein
LRVACLARVLNAPDSKGFYMARYFVGQRVAKTRPEWAPFGSNLVPHCMWPSDYYLSVCADMALCKDIPMQKASKVYGKLCPVVFPQRATDFWRRMHAGLDWTVIWPQVRDPITEPAKSDLVWIFLHRALKCRYSLRHWGYDIKTVECAVCQIEAKTPLHCLMACPRARDVWRAFLPCLRKLRADFTVGVRSAIMIGFADSATVKRLVSYLCKTIMYHIWRSRNRATFKASVETATQIVSHIKGDIRSRLRGERSLGVEGFLAKWGAGSALCVRVGDRVKIVI